MTGGVLIITCCCPVLSNAPPGAMKFLRGALSTLKRAAAESPYAAKPIPGEYQGRPPAGQYPSPFSHLGTSSGAHLNPCEAIRVRKGPSRAGVAVFVRPRPCQFALLECVWGSRTRIGSQASGCKNRISAVQLRRKRKSEELRDRCVRSRGRDNHLRAIQIQIRFPWNYLAVPLGILCCSPLALSGLPPQKSCPASSICSCSRKKIEERSNNGARVDWRLGFPLRPAPPGWPIEIPSFAPDVRIVEPASAFLAWHRKHDAAVSPKSLWNEMGPAACREWPCSVPSLEIDVAEWRLLLTSERYLRQAARKRRRTGEIRETRTIRSRRLFSWMDGPYFPATSVPLQSRVNKLARLRAAVAPGGHEQEPQPTLHRKCHEILSLWQWNGNAEPSPNEGHQRA